MEEALSVREAQAVAPADLFQIIAKVVEGPLDLQKVEVLERLLAMQERVMAEQKKTAFQDAMARLQSAIPQIDKYGQGKNSKFAKLEDIDTIARPLIAAEGFSVTFDEESHTDKTTTFVMTFSRSGHSESKRLTVAIDAAAKNREGISIRPAIQDNGSTVSYARRYLLKMHLNIVEKGEDNDGHGPPVSITDDQAKDLLAATDEVGLDRAKFCVYMHVGEVKEILAKDMQKALTVIQAKRNENATGKKK